MRTGLAALALVFLAAHAPYLPPSLEDLDSVNFALGVRHFDVAHHQPHPPGYPVFIAMGKASTAIARAAGVTEPEARGLAIWSAIGGALALVFAGLLFATIAGDDRIGLLSALLMACAPLFWFTALRPLSDMVGLAAALAALAFIVPSFRAFRPGAGAQPGSRGLVAGAFIAGVAIGVRSQAFLLTLPLLACAIFGTGQTRRTRGAAVAALALGSLVWLVPMVVVSGGPAAYLRALGSQGAEDFSGVVMLWTHRTPRVAAYALLNTFVSPWDSLVLAGLVCVLAFAGAVVLLLKAPRTAAVLALVFLPYAAFTLLFHEIVTVRYALALVPAVAFLAVIALGRIHRHAATAGAIALAVWGVVLAFPAGAAFARQPAPVARLFQDMKGASQQQGAPTIVMHRREFTETRRWREWTGGLPGRLLPAPRDYEWLEATRSWREGTTGPVWFVADPRRTDLSLIDSFGSIVTPYRWPFKNTVYVGGARPDEMDWCVYPAPGWFLEQGWALTAEVAGVTERDGWGPHRRPSIGWMRRRSGEATLLLGGRHLGGPGDPPMRVIADADGHPLLTTEIKPGFFLTTAAIPAGALAGAGEFAKLAVRAEPVTSAAPSRVALEQFDLQSPGVAMFGFDDGWYEPEYNPNTGRAWRWMSERAMLRIANAKGDVTLRIEGENPRRYYRTAPILRIEAGAQPIARFTPAADFTYIVTIPAAALAAAGGRVGLLSDQMFVPAEREGTADRRHLAIRIYSVTIQGR